MTTSRLIRFLLTFLLFVAIGFGLLQAPFSRPAVNRFTAVLVSISAFLVRGLGGHAVAQQQVLSNPVTGFQIAVEDTCNASNVVILLWAAMLAFPAGWRQRAKGVLAGTALLHAVNLLRIISLFYLGQYNASWFEFAHLYVWEGLMMVVTLVLFWAWVQNSQPAEVMPFGGGVRKPSGPRTLGSKALK
jgi:exosortase H (IPTLxxWG-CTERM-specific)